MVQTVEENLPALTDLLEQFQEFQNDVQSLRRIHKQLKRSIAKMNKCTTNTELLFGFKNLKLEIKDQIVELTREAFCGDCEMLPRNAQVLSLTDVKGFLQESPSKLMAG